MPRRLLLVSLLTLLVLGLGLGIVVVVPRSRHAAPGPAVRAGGPSGQAGEGEPEGGSRAEVPGEDEDQVASEREAALQQATSSGDFGGAVPETSHPATGWVGSRVLDPTTDDWEPAVATDPRDPYVYLLTTRYGAGKTCHSHCPRTWIGLTVSSDAGSTWSDVRPLCVCRGSKAQYDPTIEVVPNTGVVVAVFLNADRAGGFSTVYSSSGDHGQTWSDPVHVYGKVAWTDKPEVTTSASGRDVYVSWNGPQGGDPYVGQSHDFGHTWTQTKLVRSKRYFYAYDARVLPDRTVVFAESSVRYAGSSRVDGSVWHHVFISRDHGTSWENRVVAKVPVGEACVADGCSPDFYVGQASVVSDAPGHLVYAYEGPTTGDGPQRVDVTTSTDEGRTWGTAAALSVAGENATGPRLASAGDGDVRIWYQQTANGDDADAWNVWYRSSSDGGHTWSAPVKLDDAPANAAGYVHADGFDEIYGDYGEIAITSEGTTIAAWGEGFSWTGPGGTWFNVQR